MRNYYKSKFSIPRSTLPTLIKKREQIIAEIESLKSEITVSNISMKLAELESLEKKENENNSKIYQLRLQKQPKSGLINRLLMENEIKPTAQMEIKNLEEEQISLRSKIRFLDGLKIKKQSYNLDSIEYKQDFLEKIDARIIFLESKKDKLASLKNKAAKTSQEKRVISGTIKRRIAKNKNCPYCGTYITSTAHADHIYPLSKGGESVVKNMVYVCSSCNLKKKDLTLNKFIDKFDLDRDEIFDRLKLLKKDY